MKPLILLAALGLLIGVAVGLATAPRPPPPAARRPAVASASTRFSGLASSLAQEERERPLPTKLAALQHPVRQTLLPPEVILSELGVQPGMTIVDIGAGSGHLSLPMARVLAAQGRVYATDVDPRLVSMLAERAVREGLVALTPVLVGQGPDDFYRDKQFDLAVMCSVVEYLPSPSAFFRHLRPSIRAGSGRLAILQGKTGAIWFATDFQAGFRREALLREGQASPVLRRLRPEVQRQLADVPAGRALGPELAARLAEDFERLLDDPRLFAELAAFTGDGTPDAARLLAVTADDDRTVMRWIHEHFDRVGLWDLPRADLAPYERNAVRTVNWLALLRYFEEAPSREVFPRGIYLTPEGIARRLRTDGFVLVRASTVLPAHDFLIFTPATDGPIAPNPR